MPAVAAVTGTPPHRRGGPDGAARGQRAWRNTPRRRGRRGWWSQSCAGLRNIPASAGRTFREGRHAPGRAGTPPASAGRPRELVEPLLPVRNTPASAGSTAPSGADSASWVEHPASAGRISTTCSLTRSTMEDPCVGREDIVHSKPATSSCGTPPRPRGKTKASTSSTGWTTDHPRVGGKDPYVEIARRLDGGAPPRQRGGLGDGGPAGSRQRNTPASAGRTGPATP